MAVDVVYDLDVLPEPARRPERRRGGPGPGRPPGRAVRHSRARRGRGGRRGRDASPRSRSWHRTCAVASSCGSCPACELGPSPRWMAQRLLAAGHATHQQRGRRVQLRDAGAGPAQPHLRPGQGAGRRPAGARGRDGETVVTLDGVLRTLTAADGVIADGDDQAIGLAGVMGGASTEISDTTTDVLLELAWWDPLTIAGTAARLNLHSEASLRFKRGTDPELPPLAARRFAQLLGQVGGARLHPGEVDVAGDLPARETITVRPDRVNALLGTSLDPSQMRRPAGAHRLHLGGVRCGPGGDRAVLAARLLDRGGRDRGGRPALYGYSRIDRTVPVSSHPGALSAHQRARRAVRRALLGFGVSEAMPMPFLAPGDLERCGLPADGLVLANPLAGRGVRPAHLAAPGPPRGGGLQRQPPAHRGVAVGDRAGVRAWVSAGWWSTSAASELLGRVLDGEREHLGVALAGARRPWRWSCSRWCSAPSALRPLVLRPRGAGGTAPRSGRGGARWPAPRSARWARWTPGCWRTWASRSVWGGSSWT